MGEYWLLKIELIHRDMIEDLPTPGYPETSIFTDEGYLGTLTLIFFNPYTIYSLIWRV